MGESQFGRAVDQWEAMVWHEVKHFSRYLMPPGQQWTMHYYSIQSTCVPEDRLGLLHWWQQDHSVAAPLQGEASAAEDRVDDDNGGAVVVSSDDTSDCGMRRGLM